ncbi:reticulon-like protein B21 [Quercus lobata]|uniref:Reticulon-like protein n=1 Tax=Quercus lobata TaxID=97700 RepID=A0A7N2R075_QUELO|nr:reticulon-like protein B21 [Quercus lobata]
MEVGRRRSVVPGSVWESRMKVDEVKGGIKVFNGEESAPDEESGASTPTASNGTITKPKRSPNGGVVASSGKRKTWKSESSFEGFDKSPIQVSKRKSEELSVSAEGMKKSPVQSVRKLRSESSKELGEKSPIPTRKPRSEHSLVKGVKAGESGEGTEKKSGPLRKVKSELVSGNGIETSSSSSELRKVKSEVSEVVEESGKGIDEGSVAETEKSPVDETVEAEAEAEAEAKAEAGSDETCKEFGVCEEKVITDRSVVNYAPIPKVEVVNNEEKEDDGLDVVDGEDEYDDVDDADEEELVEEIEIDVKKINVPEEPKKIVSVNEEKKLHQVNRQPIISVKQPLPEPKKIVNVNEEKKLHQVNRQPTVSVKQTPPLEKHCTTYQSLSKPISRNQNYSKPTPRYQNLSKPTPRNQNVSKPTSSSYESHSKLQSFVDLVMWKEVPRSALVVLIGSFMILSSSYTKDVNLSFVSVISYLGLVYLAAIFIYRSLIFRGAMDINDSNYVLGEEEAMWLLRLVLPYVNELLLKLRALFSGDPSTTMKLAVLLFVLARCGSCITIWTVVKLGFLGVFTVPKLCSLYSAQLTAIARFWLGRFHDIWDSCSHKKAVAAATVFLILNLSSAVARIWEVFMLYVAFRCYQQSSITDEWVEDEAGSEEK